MCSAVAAVGLWGTRFRPTDRSRQMQIRARMSMSADGYVTTPGGWPALTADPAFVSGQSHGIREFLEGCEAALMGRTTFEPALSNERWPWPNLDVFVLSSERPAGTPDHVVSDSDPAILLEKLRAANRGGDVHLVGGPRTIETFRSLGALDTLELVVVPLLLGDGMRLTSSRCGGASSPGAIRGSTGSVMGGVSPGRPRSNRATPGYTSGHAKAIPSASAPRGTRQAESRRHRHGHVRGRADHCPHLVRLGG